MTIVCTRCGREDATAVEDEGGWEVWSLGTGGYCNLCPDCVPVALSIVGRSRRTWVDAHGVFHDPGAMINLANS